MPILNGYDATRVIKEKCKSMKHVPVTIIGYTSLLSQIE